MSCIKHAACSAALLTSLALVTPAFAAVSVCSGANCVATSENVTINRASNVATVTGETRNSDIGVLFTSATDMLNGNASGQAPVSAVDGLLNSLTFTLAGGATFGSATFNLSALPGNQVNEATQAGR